MGTMIEADNIDKVFEASKAVMDTLFEVGVTRVKTIIKIDERHDKEYSLEDKMISIGKFT